MALAHTNVVWDSPLRPQWLKLIVSAICLPKLIAPSHPAVRGLIFTPTAGSDVNGLDENGYPTISNPFTST
jgi:hypothetical protein